VSDWNKGWDKVANFLWKAAYESASFVIGEGATDAFEGLVIQDKPENIMLNQITLDELGRKVNWKSSASADYLNPVLRGEKFKEQLAFVAPMLKEMATFNPVVFKKYFLRWMQRWALESDVPGMEYLIPTVKELEAMPPQQIGGILDTMSQTMQAGQAPSFQTQGLNEQQPQQGGMQ
jgi:hypothetical protein